MDIKIKPSLPGFFFFIAISCLCFSGMLFFSKYLRLELIALAIFFIMFACLFLWIIEHRFMKFYYGFKGIRLEGYFSLKKIEFTYDDLEGYKVFEMVDQLGGLREEIILVLRDGRKIHFSKIGYSDDAYREIRSVCEVESKFLGNTKIKHGKAFGKILPSLFAISGILAILAAIVKTCK